MTRLAFTNGIVLALQTIRTHKLRAFLTVLGVIIGTGTIIGVSAILTGFDAIGNRRAAQFRPELDHRLQISGGAAHRPSHARGAHPQGPHLSERRRISANGASRWRTCPPMLFPNHGMINVHYKGNDMYDVNLIGVEEAYARGGQVDLHLGRFFTRRGEPPPHAGRGDRAGSREGALRQRGPHRQIHPGGRPRVQGDRHHAAAGGVLLRRSRTTRVLLPYGTMQKMYPNARENAIVVTAKAGKLPQAQDEIRTVLRIDRRVPYDKPDNFALSTAEQMVADFRQITAMTFLVMVVLSSIGLLVGGIGVMNIMLVSVTERTYEIGIRKAIGARRADILIQFLIEAAALTVLGGLAGIAFGWLISLISRLVFTSIPGQRAAVGRQSWAIVVSVGVGLFFGIWPANKAARLDPVVALRYE